MIPCSSYYANAFDILFALSCNISDPDIIGNGVRFDISGLGVLELFTSLNKSYYSLLCDSDESG